jgi:Holliday junction resolvase RusA-like endonuclease
MEIIIPSACVPKARPRSTINKKTGKIQVYTAGKSAKYAHDAKIIAQNQCQLENFTPIPEGTPVRIMMEFVLTGGKNWHSAKKPDIVNLEAQIADVLTGIAYDDDKQIVELLSRKVKGTLPMTRILVEPYE